jgi:hypothetical protein
MNSYPLSHQVLDDIGEKPVEAFSRCVARARADLRLYRRTFPQWVADHSERGLANWINDRLWAHLTTMAESIPGMELIEKGVTREVMVGLNFRFRVKRHDDLGNVASYPTPTFLEFVCQPQGQLPGLEETRLIAGYDWSKDERDIGAAVLSLRDGKDNIIWKEELPDFPEDSGIVGEVVTPRLTSPAAPVVGVPEGVGQRSKEPTEDQ